MIEKLEVSKIEQETKFDLEPTVEVLKFAEAKSSTKRALTDYPGYPSLAA